MRSDPDIEGCFEAVLAHGLNLNVECVAIEQAIAVRAEELPLLWRH
jgi:hypothetical protein